MPWKMNDYPPSLKNLDKITRKKAIDIANAMIEEGYSENRAIPIATAQAKKWYEHATDEEIEEFDTHGDVINSTTADTTRPGLLDKTELVVPHDDGWAVQAESVKRPTKIFHKKTDAVAYGKEIVKNKRTALLVYKQMGRYKKRFSLINTCKC